LRPVFFFEALILSALGAFIGVLLGGFTEFPANSRKFFYIPLNNPIKKRRQWIKTD
jgi:ABC-type antimicrobial peptide transport system permease subunit